VRVVVNADGSVASVTTGSLAASDGQRPELARRPAMEAFFAAAAEAIKQWRYEAPFKGPIQFYVGATFRPETDAVVTQSESGRGVVAGRGDARLATAADRARLQDSIAGRPAAVATPPADGGWVRVGGAVAAPMQLRKVNPVYPPIARSARVQGVVIVELNVDTQGFVTDARVLRSIPLLDQAALDAVRQWQYTPTLLNGVPVPVVFTATVQFSLDQP
jgi:protein TonB